jgi:hypothetical protein
MDDRGAIRAALAASKRCLRCIAVASGVSARRVADELRTVAEGAEVLTYEGHCHDCHEYRCLFRVEPTPHDPSPGGQRIA